MSRRFLRVAKVGGSLFDFEGLPTALRCWIDSQPGNNVLIAGGGSFVEVVRQADTTFQLGDQAAHRLALEAMRLSARLLHQLISEAAFCQSLEQVKQEFTNNQSKLVVFDAFDMVVNSTSSLPSSWDVTSDSIAADLARQLNSHELVLFKSTHLPANTTRQQAVKAGLVDKYFVDAALGLSGIRWINLRGTPVTERPM